MRRKGILIIGIVMALATAGVVYAHWQSTLVAEGNIETGGMYVGWGGAWTNDDADDEGGEVFDMWPGESGPDPANPDGSERYDKDVAGCWAEGGGEHLSFWVSNAYPSYHCMVEAMLGNYSSVPAKATAMRITVGYERCEFFLAGGEPIPLAGDETSEWADWNQDGVYDPPEEFRIYWNDSAGGPYGDFNGNGYYDEGEALDFQCYPEDDGFQFVSGEYEGNFAIGQGDPFEAHITGDIGMGVRCGTQIDPGEEFLTAGWIHVEQPAWQNYGYNFRLEQDFVNWNEFSYCMCTDGVPAANADGDIIGMVNHATEGCVDYPPEPEVIRVYSAPLSYSAEGWGGWSCPASHPNAIDAGSDATGGFSVIVAEPGASLDGFTYPVFPHYTYPGGEEGVAGHNAGSPAPITLWVDCAEW